MPSVRSSASIAGGAVAQLVDELPQARRASSASPRWRARTSPSTRSRSLVEPGEQRRVGFAVDLDVEEGLEHRRLASVRIVRPPVAMPSRRPAASRCTRTIGCTTRCNPRSWRSSSIVTESTRNGMSSFTIWTIVWLASHPSSARLGANTRTIAVPGARCCARSQWQRATARSSSRIAVLEVLGRELARSSSGRKVSNSWSSEDTTLRPYPGPAAGASRVDTLRTCP